MTDICNQIYSTVEGATIVYISLLKQFDEAELLALHNAKVKKIKEQEEKDRKEREEADQLGGIQEASYNKWCQIFLPLYRQEKLRIYSQDGRIILLAIL